jgi:hypothetical protein
MLAVENTMSASDGYHQSTLLHNWWDLERPNLKWPKKKRPKKQMAEKEVFQHLAELVQSQSKWTSTSSFQSTCSGFSQFHRGIAWLRWNYRVLVKLPGFSKKNHKFCMNLNFFYIFRNIG